MGNPRFTQMTSRPRLPQPFGLLLVLLISTPTVAQSEPTSPLGEAFVIVAELEPINQKPERRRLLARKIAEHCKIYAAAIPTLSPREDDWLDREYKERPVAAIETLEFAKRMAGEVARSCLDYAEKLSQPLDINEENFQWARLATLLLYDPFTDFLSKLSANKMVYLSQQDISAPSLWPTLSRHILERIILPFLALELAANRSQLAR